MLSIPIIRSRSILLSAFMTALSRPESELDGATFSGGLFSSGHRPLAGFQVATGGRF